MEIELKAHVHDREAVLGRLRSFASYEKTVSKDDQYYSLLKEGAPGGHISARVRVEKRRSQDGKIAEEKTYLTYKKKERRAASGGVSLEVNQEYESEIQNPTCVQELLKDAGFVPSLKKHKDSVGFYADTPCGRAHLELCAVQPLGDFLEMEFVTQGDADEEEISAKKKELEALVVRSGLALEDIEEKYYSELLAENGGKNV